MKLKYLLLFLGASTLFACDDTLGTVGTSVQPDADKLTLYSDTLFFTKQPTTFKVDSFYAVSSNALLGSFNDPKYGNLQCDFMAQLKTRVGYRFTDVYQDKIDSATITMSYSGYVGDSLTTMQATVYQLNNPLKKEMYADSKVSDYCDKSIILGRKAYTAYDVSGKNPTGTIQVRVSNDFAAKFYAAIKANPTLLDSDAEFQKFFQGIYVTNTFGAGSILNIDDTKFSLFYHNTPTIVAGSNGKDSTVYHPVVTSFAVTSEVLLVNRYENSRLDGLLAPETNVSYLKSPAGVFTRLSFPLAQINNKVGKGKLNGAKLKIYSYRVNNNSSTLQPPTSLLLIKKNAINSFFNKAISLNDSIANSSVAVATRNSSDGTYTFSNLSPFLNNFLPNSKNGGVLQDQVEFALVPVQVSYDYYGNITNIKHDNVPSGLKFYTSPDKFKLSIFYAK